MLCCLSSGQKGSLRGEYQRKRLFDKTMHDWFWLSRVYKYLSGWIYFLRYVRLLSSRTEESERQSYGLLAPCRWYYKKEHGRRYEVNDPTG
jgi:hypothetical protein